LGFIDLDKLKVVKLQKLGIPVPKLRSFNKDKGEVQIKSIGNEDDLCVSVYRGEKDGEL